jgi:hypothetical protein
MELQVHSINQVFQQRKIQLRFRSILEQITHQAWLIWMLAAHQIDLVATFIALVGMPT